MNARVKHWRKLINYQIHECIVQGYDKKAFGLLLTDPVNKKPLGTLKLMPAKARSIFFNVAKDIKINEDKNHVFLDPCIRCKVKSIGKTQNGYLRTPSFVEFII